MSVQHIHSTQLQKLFTSSSYLDKDWHNENFMQPPQEAVRKPTWKFRDKMKTSGAALCICLNVGTDPPDIVRPIPSARMECWFDPFSTNKMKALETIGNNLLSQYEKMQAKGMY